MRLTSSLLVMPLFAASPIVTFKGTATLVKETVNFLVDATTFAHDKVVAALPQEYRATYVRSQADVKIYYEKNAAPLVDMALETAQTLLLPANEVLAGLYVQLDAINHSLLDGLLSDFESHYPKRAGAIGFSLADRAIFALWVYVLLNGLKTALFGKRKTPSANRTCCF